MPLVTKSTLGELSTPVRVLLALVGCACLAMLLLAGWLEPDSRGFGTHEQLGLAPCMFQEWTEKKCPLCGATTAWAYAVRGEVVHALRVNLGGALLCGMVALTAVWMFVSAVVGRWVLCSPALRPTLATGATWLLIVMLDWFFRCWTG